MWTREEDGCRHTKESSLGGQQPCRPTAPGTVNREAAPSGASANDAVSPSELIFPGLRPPVRSDDTKSPGQRQRSFGEAPGTALGPGHTSTHLLGGHGQPSTRMGKLRYRARNLPEAHSPQAAKPKACSLLQKGRF